MSVTVHQRPVETTRGANTSCRWVAEAIVNGRTYTAISRMAAANDIARALVADGVPDAPMHVYTAGLKGSLTWLSFHGAAERTIEENSSTPVHGRRYRLPALLKQGVNAPAGTPVAPEPSAAVVPIPAGTLLGTL